MLTAACYFRGNYMTPAMAELVIDNLCAFAQLRPDYWNIFEPINVPFVQQNKKDVVAALCPAPSKAIRSLVFFRRKSKPTFLLSVDLCLCEYQGSTPHNSLSFDDFTGDAKQLAQYLARSIAPHSPDYATIPEWQHDKERYKELRRSYSPKEFVEMLGKKHPVTAPFGPHGSLADVQWFNYFGRVYVDAIGKARLMGAGWERVEEIGDGLACYATTNIDDPHSRQRRSSIAKAIEEFVWTPGCRPEEKRIATFEFSEQVAAMPADVMRKLNLSSCSNVMSFAGLSLEEREQALRALKTGTKKKE